MSLLVSTLLLLGRTVVPAIAQTSPDLESELAGAAERLREAWRRDPLTAALPWPTLHLLREGEDPRLLCGRTGESRSSGIVTYCVGTNRVLVRDGQHLRKRRSRAGEGVVAYWLAHGAALSLQARQARATSLPAAAADLQTTCLAAGLLSQALPLPGLEPGQTVTGLQMEASFHSPEGAERSFGQRRYAVLSGLGATASTCSDQVMERLAMGSVPDRTLLQQLSRRGPISTPLDSRCRQPPCPRGLGSLLGP
jgi:hypothetical protein